VTDQPLTVEQVAEFCQCHPKTVYRAIESGDLEAARLGEAGALRITHEQIDEWFARRSTRRELEAQESTPRTLHPPIAPRGRPSRGGDRLRGRWDNAA
jgi:excisionase family DNA binding protein